MLPIPADYPENVFTLLGDSHEIHAVETATEICPERLCGTREREPQVDRLKSLAKDLRIVSLHLVAPESVESDLPAVDQTFGDFGGGGKDEAAPRKQPGRAAERPHQPAGAVRRVARPDQAAAWATRPVLPAHGAAAHPLAVPPGWASSTSTRARTTRA